MKVIETTLPGVLLLEPRIFSDDRGFFMETYHGERFASLGIDLPFVQDNHSFSSGPVLRGLHYQEPNAQGKLVHAVTGAIFDVAVDIRKGSPTFGRWFGTELSAENRRMLWVPPGFAHGFCLVSPTADVIYKCTTSYDAASDRSIRWDDPELGIDWPVREPNLSAKDAAAPLLRDALLPLYVGGTPTV
jgi:dTDP-4-dehydrorhamnose 3,5-epimerase